MLVCWLVVVACPAVAQETLTIRGTVTDMGWPRALAEVQVTVSTRSDSILGGALTDASGRFWITFVRPAADSVLIAARHFCYGNASDEPRPLSVGVSEQVVELRLVPRRPRRKYSWAHLSCAPTREEADRYGPLLDFLLNESVIATRVETWIDAESVALLTDHLLPGTEVRVGDRLLAVRPRDFPGLTRGCPPEESVIVNGSLRCPHAFLRYLTVEFDYDWPGPEVRGWIAASHWYESRVRIGRVDFKIRESQDGLHLTQLGRE